MGFLIALINTILFSRESVDYIDELEELDMILED